jgi:hypothetical protein
MAVEVPDSWGLIGKAAVVTGSGTTLTTPERDATKRGRGASASLAGLHDVADMCYRISLDFPGRKMCDASSLVCGA